MYKIKKRDYKESIELNEVGFGMWYVDSVEIPDEKYGRSQCIKSREGDAYLIKFDLVNSQVEIDYIEFQVGGKQEVSEFKIFTNNGSFAGSTKRGSKYKTSEGLMTITNICKYLNRNYGLMKFRYNVDMPYGQQETVYNDSRLR